jgi:hypothetical protein
MCPGCPDTSHDAPERTRTSTDHTVHKALDLFQTVSIRPAAFTSSRSSGFRDASDRLDDMDVAKMLPRIRVARSAAGSFGPRVTQNTRRPTRHPQRGLTSKSIPKKYKEVRKALAEAGWSVVRQRGSHEIWVHQIAKIGSWWLASTAIRYRWERSVAFVEQATWSIFDERVRRDL